MRRSVASENAPEPPPALPCPHTAFRPRGPAAQAPPCRRTPPQRSPRCGRRTRERQTSTRVGATQRAPLRRLPAKGAHMVMLTSGSTPMASAASSEFSTNSRTVVYRHLPSCAAQRRRERVRPPGQSWPAPLRRAAHVVEAGDVAVLGEELRRRLGLQLAVHLARARLVCAPQSAQKARPRTPAPRRAAARCGVPAGAARRGKAAAFGA